jgi:hypothetical protein
MLTVWSIVRPILLGLGRLQKKHKCAKRALEVNKGSAALGNEETIPYPTGQTPSQGDFQLTQFLKINQEEYNSFIIRTFLSVKLTC